MHLRGIIAETLKKRIYDTRFKMITTYKAGNNLIHSMTEKIREVLDNKLFEWGIDNNVESKIV